MSCRSLKTIFFTLALALPLAVSQRCYLPNGDDRAQVEPSEPVYQYCNTSLSTTGHSMCCNTANGGQCMDTGLCKNTKYSNWWREGCTDPTWKDPACLQLYVSGTDQGGRHLDSITIDLARCSDGSYCPGTYNFTCCGDNKGIKIANGAVVLPAQDTQSSTAASSATPSATSSATSASSSSTSTNPPTSTAGPLTGMLSAPATSANATPASDASSNGPSTGVVVGAVIGGIALGAAFAALLFFFLRRRRAQASAQHATPDVLQSQSTENGSIYQEKAWARQHHQYNQYHEMGAKDNTQELAVPMPVYELSSQQRASGLHELSPH